MVRMYCSCWCSASRALRRDDLALLRVVEVGQAGVVELEVGAAEVGDAAQLLGVRRGEVGPELVELGVDGLVDGGTTAAVVDHARRRDRQLRGEAVGGLSHGLLQELERVAEDRVAERDAVVHLQRGGLEVEVAVGVVEVHLHLLVGVAVDALELVDEVHVPRRTTELAVRRGLQAGVRAAARPPRRWTGPRPRAARRRRSRRRRAARGHRAEACGRSRLPTWSARKGGLSSQVAESFWGAMNGLLPARAPI